MKYADFFDALCKARETCGGSDLHNYPKVKDNLQDALRIGTGKVPEEYLKPCRIALKLLEQSLSTGARIQADGLLCSVINKIMAKEREG